MVCPVCTIAVAFGVGIMRGLGIDDVITGMWYGALVVSSILWMLDYMQRKNWRFPGYIATIWLSFIVLFAGPLWWPWPMVGVDANGFFGLKLLLGILIGGVIFCLSVLSEGALRRLNQGKVVVYYQKVIIPLLYLILASVTAHFVLGIIG